MAKSTEELKSLLMKVKVESENVGLNLNFHKTKIMASSPITSWQIDGKKMEPKQKQHPVVDVTGDGSKVYAIKCSIV